MRAQQVLEIIQKRAQPVTDAVTARMEETGKTIYQIAAEDTALAAQLHLITMIALDLAVLQAEDEERLERRR